MKFLLFLLCALATLLMSGCGLGRNRNRMPPEKTTDLAATPSGPCRDDENFDKGKCSPRIPLPGK
jgi:hypothetical protein